MLRLNLAEGRFYAPMASQSPGINACALAPAHGLFAAAGQEGLLECFDLRQRACAGRLDVAEACGTVCCSRVACHRGSARSHCRPTLLSTLREGDEGLLECLTCASAPARAVWTWPGRME